MSRHVIISKADATVKTEYRYREGVDRPDFALETFDSNPIQADAPHSWRCECGEELNTQKRAVEHLKEMDEKEGEDVKR